MQMVDPEQAPKSAPLGVLVRIALIFFVGPFAVICAVQFLVS